MLWDISMPGMNGIELLSEIQKRHSGVSVLMLTGRKDVSLAVSAMKAGALDYVHPRRLKGSDIPLGAGVFSVVDSLDAITSDRPYHRGESCEDARREIMRNSGTQFDPMAVDYFLLVPPSIWQEIRERTLDEVPRTRPDITPLVLT